MTCSRRRTSAGRKSRVPRAGCVAISPPSRGGAALGRTCSPVADVAIGVVADARHLVVGQRTLRHLPGLPITQRARRESLSLQATSVPAATIESCADLARRSAAWRPCRRERGRRIVQPCRTAAWPDRHVVADPRGMGVPHHVDHGAVLDIRAVARSGSRCTSPRMTTFIQTLLSWPISTSPMTCALSSTNAVGWTVGVMDRNGLSMCGELYAGSGCGPGFGSRESGLGVRRIPNPEIPNPESATLVACCSQPRPFSDWARRAASSGSL